MAGISSQTGSVGNRCALQPAAPQGTASGRAAGRAPAAAAACQDEQQGGAAAPSG